jgi:hypothetical protein
MTENTDGSVEIVILLTGGVGAVFDEIPLSRLVQVGTEVTRQMAASKKERKLVNVTTTPCSHPSNRSSQTASANLRQTIANSMPGNMIRLPRTPEMYIAEPLGVEASWVHFAQSPADCLIIDSGCPGSFRKSITQRRTRSLRATATIAFFLRVSCPPVSGLRCPRSVKPCRQLDSRHFQRETKIVRVAEN